MPRTAPPPAAALGGLTVLSAAGAAAGWGQPALVLAVVLAALSLPPRWGLAVRLVLGGSAVLTLMVVVGTVAGLVSLEVAPGTLMALVLVLVGGPSIRASRGDLWRRRAGDGLVAVAALALALLAVPRMVGSVADRVGELSIAYDNSNHFLYLASVVVGRGYAWWPGGVPGLTTAPQVYTQGDAFLSAYVPWILHGGNATPSMAEVVGFAATGYPVKVVLLAVVALLLVRELVEAAGGRRAAAVVASVSVFVLLGLAMGPLMAEFGFQSQVVASTSGLVGLLALVQRSDREDGDREGGDREGGDCEGGTARTILAAGAVAVCCQTWLFVAPVVAVPLIVLLLRRSLVPGRLAWAGVGVLAAVSLAAVVHVFIGSDRVVAGTRITEAGSIWALPTVSVLLLLAGAVAYVGAARARARRGSAWAASPVLVGVVAAVVWSLGIAVVQLVSAGEVSYYLFKSVYTVAILCGLLACAWLGSFLTRSGARSLLLRTAAVCAAIWAVAPVAVWGAGYYARLEPERVDAEALATAVARMVEPSAPDVVVAHACLDEVDYTTAWTGTLTRSWTGPRRVLSDTEQRPEGSLSDRDRAALITEYAATIAPRDLEVSVPAGCSLATALDGAAPNLRVVLRAAP